MLKYLNNYGDIEVNCLIWIATVWPRPHAVCAVTGDQVTGPRSCLHRNGRAGRAVGVPERTPWAAGPVGTQEAERPSAGVGQALTTRKGASAELPPPTSEQRTAGCDSFRWAVTEAGLRATCGDSGEGRAWARVQGKVRGLTPQSAESGQPCTHHRL